MNFDFINCKIVLKEKEEKAKNAKKNAASAVVEIPNGKGAALETMSEVIKNFANESDQDLKVSASDIRDFFFSGGFK